MPMTALLIATRNAHKAREIQQVLGADFLCFTLNDFPDAPAAVEDGATFAANAAKKANVLADWLATDGRARLRRALTSIPSLPPSFFILADDSGLEVDALNGAPGVHSARFAALDTALAANSPDAANNAKLLRLLEGIPPSGRTARFRCVLALRRLSLPSAGKPVPLAPASNPQSEIRNLPRQSEASAGPQSPTASVLLEAICSGRIANHPAGSGGFGYDPLFIPDGFTQSFAELGDAVKNTISHRARALEKLRQYLAIPAP
jgi:XTP/dITP diphosphohydrolase